MDMPTLEVTDGHCEDSDEVDSGPEPWGWLFPQSKGVTAQDLVREEYTFGRGDECDYCFQTQNAGVKNSYYLSISKTHFRIYRERRKPTDSDYMVIIEDKSANGTFINGEKLGKNKKQVLNNDDEIALSSVKNKVFVFYNTSSTASTRALPEAFREKYIMSKFLGKGACGEVKLAFEKGTLNKFAVKMISKKTFSVGPVLGRAALEEVEILKSIQHPCIIRIEDVFDTPTTLYIVLELAEGGELYDRVVRDEKFSEETSKLFFYQMLMAIKYLHDRGITHRDIKPENILLNSEEKEALIKVTDFGLSRFVGENSLMKTLCGTPSYLAPEVLQSAGTAGYSKAVDLWSLGVILYIMLGGYPPFSSEIEDHTLKDQITHARYDFPKQWWGGVSEQAKDMIKRLLTLDPRARIGVDDALEHPWLRDEGVVGRAKTLMSAAGFNPPPPPLPSNALKRPAHFDEDMPDSGASGAEKPAKRPNVEEPPSTPTSNTPSPNSLNKTNGNNKLLSTASTNTSASSES